MVTSGEDAEDMLPGRGRTIPKILTRTRSVGAMTVAGLASAAVFVGASVPAARSVSSNLFASSPPFAYSASSTSSGFLGAPVAVRFAATGSIRGRVELRRPAVVADRRPNVSDFGAGGQRDLTDRTRSVVYLETAPRGAFEQPDPSHAVMNQRNETFVPHVLAITTGTVVDFPNSDHIYHNVFSLSKTGQFDLGRYAAGKSKSVRFDRPGIVRVFCEIHSHMSAFILVFGHPFFTLTDADGRYRLDNIPPGTYSVIAWNEGTASDPAPVTVPGGAAAELDITVR